MPPERSQQLVFELDAWYRSHKVRQKDLAAELNMSPQQLSEILALRNRPTGEQALAIKSFLESESQSMSTPLFEPKPDRPPRVQDPDNPLTLNSAKERIQQLNAELSQLKSTPGMTGPTGAPKPATATKTSVTTQPPAAKSTTGMIFHPAPAPITEIEKLRAQLNTVAPEQRDALYQRIKQLEGDTALRAFKRSRK